MSSGRRRDAIASAIATRSLFDCTVMPSPPRAFATAAKSGQSLSEVRRVEALAVELDVLGAVAAVVVDHRDEIDTEANGSLELGEAGHHEPAVACQQHDGSIRPGDSCADSGGRAEADRLEPVGGDERRRLGNLQRETPQHEPADVARQRSIGRQVPVERRRERARVDGLVRAAVDVVVDPGSRGEPVGELLGSGLRGRWPAPSSHDSMVVATAAASPITAASARG